MKFTKIRTVVPGDELKEKCSYSLGLYKEDNKIKSYVYGTLCRVQNHLFVISKTSRYFPYIDDIVIGRVIYSCADYYKLDLDTYIGILPVLSFTNASKRNKPDIKKDDWLLCRIIESGAEPILSCVGEGFGKLDGYVFKIKVWMCQMLYVDDFLYKIGKKYNFKCCVGINGYICITGEAITVRDVYTEIIKCFKYCFLVIKNIHVQ